MGIGGHAPPLLEGAELALLDFLSPAGGSGDSALASRAAPRHSAARSESMTPFLKKILGINWMLVLLMYGLLIFGVFMIESAARHLPVSSEALKEYGSAGKYYAGQQKNWILLGTLVFFATALVDYRWIRWLGIPFYVVSMVLMFMALKADDDVHRLAIGPISFQPVQLGITAGIIMIAWLLQDLSKIHRSLGHPMARIAAIGVVAAPPFLMTMAMGDMGSALVWGPVLIVAMIMGGIPFRYLTFMSFIGAGVLPLLYFVVLPMVSDRGPERIDLWLRMNQGAEVNIADEAYAPYYVSMAVGKSGWKGISWNTTGDRSLHDKRFIPWATAHNDFIFAVIAEELGFRGSLLLIIALAALMITCLFIAYYSRDDCGRLVCCLVVALFFAHAFENIGMCVLLMPITGIPLPLVSYSGTFAVICMFMLGLVQSVWIHRSEKPGLKVSNSSLD